MFSCIWLLCSLKSFWNKTKKSLLKPPEVPSLTLSLSLSLSVARLSTYFDLYRFPGDLLNIAYSHAQLQTFCICTKWSQKSVFYNTYYSPRKLRCRWYSIALGEANREEMDMSLASKADLITICVTFEKITQSKIQFLHLYKIWKSINVCSTWLIKLL